jgi:rhodanese-related sulfurtransferase
VARNLDPFRLRDWEGQVVYLLKGQLKVDFADGSMEVLVGGSGDALLPLCSGGIRPLSTKTITDVELVRIDEDMLDIIMTWDQVMASAPRPAPVEQEADWRTMSGVFAVQSLTQGAFKALPPAHIQALFDRFQRIKVERGQVMVKEGDAGDFYYLIERGRCLVSREVAGARVEVAELKAGDAFGEEALVADTPRNATVTMKTDGVLLRLDKTDFDELLREPLVQRLAPAEALHHVAGGAVWLDVRYPAEYQHDGLAGAINIPLNEVRQAGPMLDVEREYVVYCQTGRRSSAAAFLLSQRGFHAYLLDGGLKALSADKERMMT